MGFQIFCMIILCSFSIKKQGVQDTTFYVPDKELEIKPMEHLYMRVEKFNNALQDKNNLELASATIEINVKFFSTKKIHSMQKISSPSIGNIPYDLRLYIFFQNPSFFTTFFNNVFPMIDEINKKINPRGKAICSCLEDYKTVLHILFTSNTFISKIRLRFDLI